MGVELQLEIYFDDGKPFLYIGDESGSGWEMGLKSKDDIGKALQQYMEIYNPEIIKRMG